jgi:hypothetical protein
MEMLGKLAKRSAQATHATNQRTPEVWQFSMDRNIALTYI